MKDRYDDIDEYIKDLKAAIAENAQCADHYYHLGLALLSKRDFAGAEEALLEAVRHSPHLAEAYVQLGGICQQRSDQFAQPAAVHRNGIGIVEDDQVAAAVRDHVIETAAGPVFPLGPGQFLHRRKG